MKMHQLRSMALVSSAAILFGVGAANAAVQTVTSTIKFVTDIAISMNATPNFGAVKALQAGTYVLNTAGTVTASGGGVKEGGTPAAGSYTITGSGSQAITITSGNYANSGASTPSAATCKYGTGSEVACTNVSAAAPTTGGTVLLVGLTVTTNASGADSQIDHPAFDLTVVYQ
jgi:hypothetical protein